MDDTLAMLVVTRALVQSYPTWTDENGTNVEQLAAIAVAALAQHGLLVETDLDSADTGATVPSGVTRQSAAPAPGHASDGSIWLP